MYLLKYLLHVTCDDYNCFRTLVSHSGHILHIPPCGYVFHVLIIQENSTICDYWSACSHPYWSSPLFPWFLELYLPFTPCTLFGYLTNFLFGVGSGGMKGNYLMQDATWIMSKCVYYVDICTLMLKSSWCYIPWANCSCHVQRTSCTHIIVFLLGYLSQAYNFITVSGVGSGN